MCARYSWRNARYSSVLRDNEAEIRRRNSWSTFSTCAVLTMKGKWAVDKTRALKKKKTSWPRNACALFPFWSACKKRDSRFASDFCGNHALSWFARMRSQSRVFQLHTSHHWWVWVLRRSCPALRSSHGNNMLYLLYLAAKMYKYCTFRPKCIVSTHVLAWSRALRFVFAKSS